MFSHDKLVWELQQDAVRAAMAASQPCMPAIAPPFVPLQISALRHELVQQCLHISGASGSGGKVHLAAHLGSLSHQ